MYVKSCISPRDTEVAMIMRSGSYNRVLELFLHLSSNNGTSAVDLRLTTAEINNQENRGLQER